MKKYLSIKTIFPIFLLLFEGFWMKLTFGIKITAIDEGAFATSASFPRFILIIMMACTVASFVFELRDAAQADASETQGSPEARMDVLKVVILVICIGIYVLAFNHLGFILSTILMMLAANTLYGQRNKLLAVSVSLLFPVFLYAVFRYALKIMLPTLFL